MKGIWKRALALVMVFMLLSADVCAFAEAVAVLTLPKALKIIDEEAFYQAKMIDDIVLPEGVEEIRSKAFADSSLTRINLPDSLSYIADDAFSNCGEIDIIVNEGSYAYDRCVELGLISVAYTPSSSFAYTIVNGGIRITDFVGTETDVAIPPEIDGYPVTELYVNVFSDCTSLESVIIPSTVREIYGNTFLRCSNLKSVALPDGLTKIETAMFYGCSSLTGIDIPDTVTSIAGNAFLGCTNLQSIDIPEGVTSIGSWAFYNCEKLTAVEIPEQVKTIEARTFYGCKTLEAMVIPVGVSSIGDYAFGNCVKLKDVTIPASVVTFGKNIFNGGNSTLKIHGYEGSKAEVYASENGIAFVALPALENPEEYYLYTMNNGEVTVIGYVGVSMDVEIPGMLEGYPVTAIGDKAFYENTAITSVKMPESIRSIGSEAFKGCSSLSEVLILDNVASIGDSAFYGCKALTAIQLPSGLNSIGMSAFINCTSLQEITIPFGVNSIGSSAFNGCTSLRTAELPEGLVRVEHSMFSGCTNLESISIPETVTYFGQHAFYNCIKLKSVSIPASVTEIDNYAFWKCTSLENVNLPEGLNRIGSSAFNECTSFTKIIVPGSVTSINNAAFSNCTGVTEIVVSEGVTDLGGGHPFSMNPSLTKVTLPDTLKTISGAAFYQCTGLKEIVIPAGVTSIGVNTFSGCTNLENVTILSSDVTFGNTVFANCSNNLIIYGEENSTAQAYANKNNIIFKLIDQETIVPATGIELYPEAMTMNKNGVRYVSARVMPTDATNTNVIWESSNSSVVSVDEHGILTSHAVGKAIITATTEDGAFTDNCVVTVVERITGSVSVDREFALTGEEIVFTAEKENGGSAVEYVFTVYCDGKAIFETEALTEAVYRYTPQMAGVYSVYAKISDETGAIAYARSGEVLVNPNTIGAVSLSLGDDEVRIGESITIQASTSKNAINLEYRFKVKQNGVVIYASEYQTAATWEYIANNTGTYTVEVVVRDENGQESGTVTATFTVKPSAINLIVADYESEYAIGEAISIQVSTTGGYGTVVFNYEMYDPDGNLVARSGDTSETSFSYTFQKAGTHQLCISAKDDSDSSAMYDDSFITVCEPERNITDLQLSAQYITLGESVEVIVSHEGAVGNVLITYEIRTPQGILIDKIVGGETLTYTPENVGEYIISVSAQDDIGIWASYAESWKITVSDKEKLELQDILVNRYAAIVGDTLTWTVKTYGGSGALSYEFKLYCNDELVTETEGTNAVFNHAIEKAGIYSVLVMVSDGETAVAQESNPVQVYEKLEIAEFSASATEAVTDESVVFTVIASGGNVPYSYEYVIFDGDNEEVDRLTISDNNELKYSFVEKGTYSVQVTVIDMLNNTVAQTISGLTITESLSDFRFTAPKQNFVYDVKGTLTVEWTEVENAVKYIVTLSDATTGGQVRQSERTRTYVNYSSYTVVPGHQYIVHIEAVDENGNVIAIAEDLAFSADPAALGRSVVILYPNERNKESGVGDVGEADLIMGQSYIIIEPVPNAKWYYAVFTPDNDETAFVTTPKTSEPYILVPTGLESGRPCTITVYAGNDTDTTSDAIEGICSYYPDEGAWTKNHHFPAAGGTVELATSCSSTRSWTAEVDGDWIKVSPMSGKGSQTVTVTVSENRTGEARTGYIVLGQNADGVEWYIITQSAFEGVEITPIPMIEDWETWNISLMCQEFEGDIANFRFGGIVTGGEGTLQRVRIVFENKNTGSTYTFFDKTVNGTAVDLKDAGLFAVAQKYTDAEGNTLNAGTVGSYTVKVYATNKNGREACIATRNLYLVNSISSYSITPDTYYPQLNDEVTWTFNYTGGGDGLEYAFYVYHNGERVKKTKFSETPYVTYELDEYGVYTVEVAVDYGGMVDGFESADSRIQLLDGQDYSDPYITSSSVSAATVEIGDSVTWRINMAGGQKPYSYKYVVYQTVNNRKYQYAYLNYDEGMGNSLTLELDEIGEYVCTATAKDAYGTEKLVEFNAVTVEETVTTPQTLFITYPTSGSTVPYEALELTWAEYEYDFSNFGVTLTDLTDNEVVHENNLVNRCEYTVPVSDLTSGHKYRFTLGVYASANSLIRDTYVDFYVGENTGGDSGDEEEPETPGVTQVGQIAVKCPVNGFSYDYGSISIAWNAVENAEEYYVALRDMTAYPGDDYTQAAEYVYDDYVSNENLTIAENKLVAGRDYRLWIEAYNATGVTLANRRVEFSIKSEAAVEVPSPAIIWDSSDASITLGNWFAFSGTVSANGGKLELIRVMIEEVATGDFCDYAIYTGSSMQNQSSFDLSQIPAIYIGEGSEIGTSGSGLARPTSQSLHLDDPGAKYVIKIYAQNEDESALTLLEEGMKVITLHKPDFMYLLDVEGNDLNGQTIQLDYMSQTNNRVYLYTNVDWFTGWDDGNFAMKLTGEVEDYMDGRKYEYELKGSPAINPYGSVRKGEIRAYQTFNGIGITNDSVRFSTVYIQQAKNPNVIDVTSVELCEWNGLIVENMEPFVLEYTLLPENATCKDVTWISSDEKIAKVDKYGRITPVGQGEATISLVANGSNPNSNTKAVGKNSAQTTITVRGRTELINEMKNLMNLVLFDEGDDKALEVFDNYFFANYGMSACSALIISNALTLGDAFDVIRGEETDVVYSKHAVKQLIEEMDDSAFSESINECVDTTIAILDWLKEHNAEEIRDFFGGAIPEVETIIEVKTKLKQIELSNTNNSLSQYIETLYDLGMDNDAIMEKYAEVLTWQKGNISKAKAYERMRKTSSVFCTKLKGILDAMDKLSTAIDVLSLLYDAGIRDYSVAICKLEVLIENLERNTHGQEHLLEAAEKIKMDMENRFDKLVIDASKFGIDKLIGKASGGLWGIVTASFSLVGDIAQAVRELCALVLMNDDIERSIWILADEFEKGGSVELLEKLRKELYMLAECRGLINKFAKEITVWNDNETKNELESYYYWYNHGAYSRIDSLWQ